MQVNKKCLPSLVFRKNLKNLLKISNAIQIFRYRLSFSVFIFIFVDYLKFTYKVMIIITLVSFIVDLIISFGQNVLLFFQSF